MRRAIRISLAGLVAAVVAVAVLAGWGWRQLNVPLSVPADGVLFEVQTGWSLTRVTTALASQGVVDSPRLMRWYARLRGEARKIHAGEYRLEPGLTAVALLDKLGRGDVYLYQFTIVEGWRFDEMLRRLREHPAIAAGTDDETGIMAALGEPGLSPEGEFLPDTYSFPRGTRDLELLRWAHSALRKLVDDAWATRTESGALSDPYDGLILASIIEKETALEGERALIAGVFEARLKRGMRLQTDPTVIYGLGAEFDGNLTRADLAHDTPYNTYTRAGLPPTPIALPGRASIHAAFSPADTDALYFVATGDPDGSHVFSRTLEEHNEAVRRYVARQRESD
jgi:peptidoglycan lytic transglycosylase G